MIIILILVGVIVDKFSIADRKFVYQKDVSEHCRRRVVPSVFLGRHVVEANSQVLHFSRLELPYSCFISVRTESGGNIILVIQLVSDQTLNKSCSESHNQLLVYEMGETFGGYWGPLPDNIIRPPPTDHTEIHTLKTTQKITPKTTIIESEVEEEETESTTKGVSLHKLRDKQGETEDQQQYFTIEVPLVNVSGVVVEGDLGPKRDFDSEDVFDLVYDVMPMSNVTYETTMLPLVQFSVLKQGGLRHGDDNQDVRYQLDYKLDQFTPDPRLEYPQKIMPLKRKPFPKYKSYVNRRLNFKTTPRSALSTTFPYFERYLTTKAYTTKTTTHDLSNELDQLLFGKHTAMTVTEKLNGNSSDIIQHLMHALNKHQIVNVGTMTHENTSELLQKISDMDHNVSVYLSPNLSIYNNYYSTPRKPINFTTKYDISSFIKGLKSTRTRSFSFRKENIDSTISSTLSYNKEKYSVISTDVGNTLKDKDITETVLIRETKIDLMDHNNYKNIVKQIPDIDPVVVTFRTSNETTLYSPVHEDGNVSSNNVSTPITVNTSMVDHESWENIVQAAPVMAVRLNRTDIYNDTDRSTTANNNDANTTHSRNKRYIHAIPIEVARPHNMTTKDDVSTTMEYSYHLTDMQELGYHVEIPDDEIQGRAALRYLRQYVGPALYNMCDYREAKTRQVFLFNSSRIVIAISNFTMERMTIVVTPSRTLVTPESRCPISHIECQVSGARVCIDSLSACDGIPNCGAYDIYDEDRLMCGAAVGLQHNVVLAAVTFVAVLLTVLYTVHYWLRRCVPKVSDAFFIYTEGVENVLYLDTIMRSPNDDDMTSKIVYRGKSFDDDILYSDILYQNQTTSKNCCKRFLNKCLNIILCRKNKEKDDANVVKGDSYDNYKERHLYSFTEIEIRKMLENKESVDVSIQTGESLEMRYLNNIRKVLGSKNKTTQEIKAIESEERSADTIDYEHSLSKEMLNDVKNQAGELNILKFLRQVKDSLELSASEEVRASDDLSMRPLRFSDEKIIQTYSYDHPAFNKPSSSLGTTTKCEIHSEKVKRKGEEPEGQARKCLRFDEELVTIPSADDNVSISEGHRRSTALGAAGWRNQDLDTIQEDEEQDVNIGRDFRRFWGNKGKKSKKKSHVSLR